MDDSEFNRIRTCDVARLHFAAGKPDAIVLELGLDGWNEPLLIWLMDAQAYTVIRQMTEVLFDVDPVRLEVDPPRSGVGSPGALNE